MQTRDAILHAVTYAASGFLRSADWRENTDGLLGQLGVATAVHRIYIFENAFDAEGTLLASQRFEWVSEGTEPQIDNPDLQNMPFVAAGFGRWAEVLGAGEVVVGTTAELPPDEGAFLQAQGIQSILVVPIFAGQTWWGFMGFDDCGSPRRWSAGEVAALRAAAGAIGAALERARIQKALAESESQLRQAQKMEAIGQLAGGVAHDFNNLLTVIQGHVELLLDQTPEPDARRADLIEVREAGRRATALTQQLLAFSRRQVLQPEVVAVNAIVDGVTPMLRRLIGSDIAIRTCLDPMAGTVLADPRQLEQVLVNLVVNARDAMPAGGAVTLETGRVDVDATTARALAGQVAGTYVLLSVSDTGTGMDRATQARIFEPFFTTKPAGRGTGLGLSTVYGIVKQSGGWVWCYSEPGHGTTFKVYLPPALVEATPPAAVPPAVEAEACTGSILLVEDDDSVRRLSHRILTRSGYEVVEAASGAEAVAIARDLETPPALVVTDLVLPDVNGPRLVEQLKGMFPEAKALYVSGYTNDDMVRRGFVSGGAASLQKPFSANGLLGAVRSALSAAES